MTDPILKYPGAKWALASWITSYLPYRDHYLDPFFGSGGVYFNLPWLPDHAVLNDLSGDVTNLFRVIRTRSSELATLVEATPWARQEYDESYLRTDDDLENARRFLVRCWQAFGTNLARKTGWRNIGTSRASTVTLWNTLPSRILDVVDRLKDAEIETKPALDVITRYRSSNVLIYADPPYPLSTRNRRMYQHEMTDDDHLALLNVLDHHPGPVALSGYACDLYDSQLSHWSRFTHRTYAERGNQRTEVLWLNKTALLHHTQASFSSFFGEVGHE